MDVSGILSQIKSGGFVNPIGSKVQSTIDSISIPTLEDFTTIANAQYAALVPPQSPVPENIASAHQAVSNAYSKMGDLIGHSDRLSGVDLMGSGSLATIAKTMNAAKSINGESSCSTVLGAFGAIQNAAELATDTLNTAMSIKNLLLDIPGQITSIPGQLETYANKIANQIISDVTHLAQAQIAVAQNAVAQGITSLFDNECTSQILSSVMAQPLKNEVEKLSAELKSKKLISIG